MSHWSHFTLEEFACPCGECSGVPMEFRFVTRLDALRDFVGFPLYVTSGHRCPDYDHSIGGAGVHPHGVAADLGNLYPARMDAVVRAAVRMGFRGIGINGKGPPGKRFVHLDDLDVETHPRPRVWTY